MRLLNTSTLTIKEFYGSSIPPYTILSHRWESEEVTFQDILSGRGPAMAGYSKILGCASQAGQDGWSYVWIDSCCIDKTSSAELSEAINSMFQWYQKAQVCYVYMSDVENGQQWSDHERAGSQFRLSKWWSRGWTLQELLAPTSLLFFSQNWMELGTNLSMAKLISSIAGIEEKHLINHTGASVAQKMSWASKRETTRIEDQAYSLMGLFDVHMPPLYGEGTKAFQRLQKEILLNSDDESLFAWSALHRSWDGYGLLAQAPSMFAESGNIIVRNDDVARPPFVATNKGLRIDLILYPTSIPNQFLAPLNCGDQRTQDTAALMLFKEIGPVDASDRYSRLEALRISPAVLRLGYGSQRSVVYVKQDNREPPPMPSDLSQAECFFAVETKSLLQHGFEFYERLQVICYDKAYSSSISPQSSMQLISRSAKEGKLQLAVSRAEEWIVLRFSKSSEARGLLFCIRKLCRCRRPAKKLWEVGANIGADGREVLPSRDAGALHGQDQLWHRQDIGNVKIWNFCFYFYANGFSK